MLLKKKYLGKQFGKYTIDNPLGEGRYGQCFVGTTNNGKKVAIKKFKPHMLKKSTVKHYYEAVILSKLNDNRFPEFLGVINEKGFYGFVLELKNGTTVEEMLFKHKHQFSNQEFYNIGLKLIKIIKHLHQNGIVHRDIRIPNVLIENHEVFLVDFGLARWADNIQYRYDLDFCYLGDFMLYLLYSSYKPTKKHKNKPWYIELPLTEKQKLFLKRLLGLEIIYQNIDDIEIDFINAFKI